MISSLVLLVTVGITSVSVTERVQLARYGEKKKGLWVQVFNVITTLYGAVLTLPRRIGLIFCIQLCSWYGWFLFLFYSSTWVGEIYTKYSRKLDVPSEGEVQDAVGDIARVGSLSLTVFSTVSLILSLFLPELLRRVNGTIEDDNSLYPGNAFLGLGSLPRTSVVRKFRQGVRLLMAPFQEFFTRLTTGQSLVGKIDLTLFWLISQILYAITSFAMLYVRSLEQASVIVGLFGVCWAVTTWAPFSLLAEEVLLIGQAQQTSNKYQMQRDTSGQKSLYMRGSRAQDIEMISMYENDSRTSTESTRNTSQPMARYNNHARSSSAETMELHVAQPAIDEQDQLSPKRKKPYTFQGVSYDNNNNNNNNSNYLGAPAGAAGFSSSFPRAGGSGHTRNISLTEDDFYSDGSEIISTTGEHSGVYLGLHNVAITVPQLISTFVSFLVFSVLEPLPLTGDNEENKTSSDIISEPTTGDGGFAIAVTMQLGGIAALFSAYFILQLRRSQVEKQN